MPSTKKSISKRAASIVSSASVPPSPPLPTTPSSASLSALATDRCNIQGNSSRVKPAAKQRVDSLAASQVGRQVGHFACCCYPQGLFLSPFPLWHLHACINLNILCCVDARMPYELSARYRSVCFKLNCKYLNVAGPDIDYTPSVLSQTVN